jgi:hypothetical protein
LPAGRQGSAGTVPIQDLPECIRIRTGETGSVAIGREEARLYMARGAEVPLGVAEDGSLVFGPAADGAELRHIRAVTASLLRGAVLEWDEVWRELREHVGRGPNVRPGAAEGFVPSRGWPEFLERVWMLRHHLDSAMRFVAGEASGREASEEDAAPGR